jgi:hypothetical protein
MDYAKSQVEDCYFYHSLDENQNENQNEDADEADDETCERFTGEDQINTDTEGLGVMLYYSDVKGAGEIDFKRQLVTDLIAALNLLQHQGSLIVKVSQH